MTNQEVFPKMHAGLHVSDLEATIKFYTYFLGVAPIKVKEKYAKFMLNSPPLVISFSERNEPSAKKFAHFGIQVDSHETLKSWKEQIIRRGISIHSEEEKSKCCYALQDKFWVQDPDGVMWEIYYFHEDVEENDKHYQDHDLIKESTNQEGKCCEPISKR
jgi:catechol-2,3-dioxygenase